MEETEITDKEIEYMRATRVINSKYNPINSDWERLELIEKELKELNLKEDLKDEIQNRG